MNICREQKHETMRNMKASCGWTTDWWRCTGQRKLCFSHENKNGCHHPPSTMKNLCISRFTFYIIQYNQLDSAMSIEVCNELKMKDYYKRSHTVTTAVPNTCVRDKEIHTFPLPLTCVRHLWAHLDKQIARQLERDLKLISMIYFARFRVLHMWPCLCWPTYIGARNKLYHPFAFNWVNPVVRTQ